MNNFIKFFLFFLFVLMLSSCNKGKNPNELRAKSTAVGDIIQRSGTQISGNEKEALIDAQNRLRTGGGLLGKKPLSLDLLNQTKNTTVSSVGLPINPSLWKGALEVISFMPISSADAFGGVIITDWYSSSSNNQERCKLNIFIRGAELKSNNIKVRTFCQVLNNNNVWINKEQPQENNNKLENAILNKAKKINLASN
tara:strand:+ start:1514 stop:2104 length:591 start_codon:yes stop_codon:yes gene_type:complete